MFDDEDAQNKPKTLKNLESMSLNELDNYIQELREEIIRVEAERDKKKAYMDTLNSAFK